MTKLELKCSLDSLKKLEEKLTESVMLKVGWFPSAVYTNNTEDGKEELPVAMVAAIQEKGLPGRKIPPRPFLGPAADNNRSIWSKILNDQLKKNSLRTSFEILGLRAQEDVSLEISKVTSPPLKDSTVMNRLRRYSQFKGRKVKEKDLEKEGVSIRKPLVDTGYMKATVSYEVE